MVRRLLAAAALLCLPAAAEAVSFSLQNCSAGTIDIVGYNDAREMPYNNPSSSTYAHTGQSGLVQCETAACLIRIVAIPPGGAVPEIVGFAGSYTSDVCTRGTPDRGRQLTAAGTCGC